MPISKDLLLAILSMDSYNRGYGAGIDGLSSEAGTTIGTATIGIDSSDDAGIAEDAVTLSERSYDRAEPKQVDVYIGDENKINDITGTSGDDFILTGAHGDLITGGKGKNFINAGEGVDEARYVGGIYLANDNRLIIGRQAA